MWLHVVPGRPSLRRSQPMPPKALLCARMLDDDDVGEAKAQRRLWHTRVGVCVSAVCVCVCAACRRHCSGLSLPKSGVPYAHAWPILNFFTPPSRHHQPLLLLLPYRSPATALPAPTHHRCRLAVAAVAAPCCLPAGCCRRHACILYSNLLFSSSLLATYFRQAFPLLYSLLNPEHNALYPLHLPPTHQPPPLSEELSSVVCIGCSITAAAAAATTRHSISPRNLRQAPVPSDRRHPFSGC